MVKRKKAIAIKSGLVMLMLLMVVMLTSSCKLTQKQTQDQGTPAPTYDPEALYNTSGHADSTAEAFLHWNEDDPPLVPASCARCHTTGGFIDFVDDFNVSGSHEPGVLGCETCHTNPSTGATRDIGKVIFPSGALVENLQEEAICMQCHQGRSSKNSVDEYFAGRGATMDDTVYTSLSFRNIHYYAAAATLYGKFAEGGYQYNGKAYDGKNIHVQGYARCISCHDPHSLQIKIDECSKCHSGLTDTGLAKTANGGGLYDIRKNGSLTDYDGDGDVTEGIYYEITTLREYLQNVMWSYSKDVCGSPIVYDTHTYPYFFTDTNENGMPDPEEINNGNSFRRWTPRLMKAAYNYQVSLKDPGAFAHGGKYLIQLMYDSIMDILEGSPNPIQLPLLHRDDEGHFDGSAEAWRHWDEDGEVSGSCAKCHGYNGLPEYLATGKNTNTPIPNGMLCTTCHEANPASRGNIRTVNSVTFPSGAELSLDDGTSNICLNCHQGRASKKDVDAKIAGGSGNYSFTNIHYYPSAAVLFGSEAQGGYEYPGKFYAGRKQFTVHQGKFDTCAECHMGAKGKKSVVGHNVRTPNPADCVECHGDDVSQPFPGRDPNLFRFEGIRPRSVPDYDGDGDTSESLHAEINGLEVLLYAQMKLYSKNMLGKAIAYDSHSYPYFFNDTNGNGVVDPAEANRSNGFRFDASLLKAAYNYQLSRKEPNGFVHNSMYVAQLLTDSIQDLGGNISAMTWR